MKEKFVWVVIGTRTLEVYDNFDVALKRYNQIRGNSKSMDVQIHKRPIHSKLSESATMD